MVLLGCGPRIEWPEGSASGEAGDVEASYRGLLRVAEATLLDIDPEDGSATELCELAGLGSEGTQSLAFTRDGRLFATYGKTALYEIDPCACEAWEVGPYGFTGVGLAADRDHGLWGVASEGDAFLRIDADTGRGTAVGSLRRDVTNHGATWSERDETVYVLVGSGPGELHTADPATGALTSVAAVDRYLSSGGFEYHAASGELYACTSDGVLLTIDPETGRTTAIGDTGYPGCDNLAAPPISMPRGCLP